MEYQKEIEFLNSVEEIDNIQNRRVKLSKTQIDNLKKGTKELPEDYILYLEEVGVGNFRECQFNVHENLFTLKDLGLDEHYDIKSSIKFFGDNFSGDFSGFDFDNEDGKVVEFWHEDGTIYETEKTFKQYIREQMLMDENGNDLRE